MPGSTLKAYLALLVGIVAAAGFPDCARAADQPVTSPVASPVSPEDSLRHFALNPALRIELVACEPEVVDPVAIAFNEDGRLWVVEMRDYPNGPQPGETPKSRIRVLDDRDGDGRYEAGTTFADGLLFATGLQPWRGGVIVTLGGEVAYFRDNDGDGRADLRETWFSGFLEENPQLRANHPTFGPDNHIHVANGLRGGTVVAKRDEWAAGAQPVSISGMDFRFDPLTGKYEAVSGVGQFGLTFDDFGNRFVCSNRNPCRHVVLEDRDLKRNPHLAVANTMHDVSPAEDQSRVYPLVAAWTTSTLHAGQFTAACGVTIYRGDALPRAFQGNSFTCEPTGSLVHRDVLEPSGATFVSHSGEPEGTEFLASRDPWFRPVNLALGPDGALYVVDMYRAVIEHPQFMPEELQKRPDLRLGDDRGRIYRIVAKDAPLVPDERRRPRLSVASTADLVALLDHPNAWHRTTAARLLFERQDRSAEGVLIDLARNGRTPEGRVQALHALRGLGRLSGGTVLGALADESPRVVEQAVRLSEGWLNEDAALREAVIARARHEDARVRFQAALALGGIEGAEPALGALTEIAVRDAADPWARKAVLSSAGREPVALLDGILAALRPDDLRPGQVELVGEFAELVGARQQEAEVAQALRLIGERAASDSGGARRLARAGLVGLGQGLGRRGGAPAAHLARLSEPERARIAELFAQAAALARDSSAATDARLEAFSVLRYAEPGVARPVLERVFTGETEQALRLAAVEGLARLGDPEVAPLLLNGFAAQTPAVRRAILDALLARPERVAALLDAVEAKRVAATELGPAREKRLTSHPDAALRERATRLMAAAAPADRRGVLEAYQAALSLPADPGRGKAVFAKTCTACHRIGELGVNVAPDIADSRTRQPAALLTDILDPNRAIDNNYFSFTVLTRGGEVHTGVIAAETATAITLRQAEGKTLTLLRADVEELKSDGVSLMPVGLEKTITVQEMADLISFIKNWRYLDGSVPAEVVPGARGAE